MNKKDFKSTASAIITRKPTTLEEALKAPKAIEPPASPSARAVQKKKKPEKAGNQANAQTPNSKKATRLQKAAKPVRKEVSITEDLEQRLKSARIGLNMFENDIFNEALEEYLQRRDKEIKAALKTKLGL